MRRPSALGPAWIYGIGEGVRPMSSHGKGEQEHVQLALGVSSCRIPSPRLPLQIVKSDLGTIMHAGTEIDDALGRRDETGQNIWCQAVHSRMSGMSSGSAERRPLVPWRHCG